jgi:hypothetical protein
VGKNHRITTKPWQAATEIMQSMESGEVIETLLRFSLSQVGPCLRLGGGRISWLLSAADVLSALPDKKALCCLVDLRGDHTVRVFIFHFKKLFLSNLFFS